MKWLNSVRVNNSFPQWYNSDNFFGILLLAAYLNPDKVDMVARGHMPVTYFLLHVVVIASVVLFVCNVVFIVLTFF